MADTIVQWHNAGGMVQFYDFSLEEYINVSIHHTPNSKSLADILTFQGHGCSAFQRHPYPTHLGKFSQSYLSVKYDLALFENALIPQDVDSKALTMTNAPLMVEAGKKALFA